MLFDCPEECKQGRNLFQQLLANTRIILHQVGSLLCMIHHQQQQHHHQNLARRSTQNKDIAPQFGSVMEDSL